MATSEGFAAIPNWLIRDTSVSAYAIAVYGALASHSGPGGIHPSQATLAVEARCSERTVRNALLELEQLGVVERVRRVNKSGRASNGYTLHPNGRLGVDEVPAPDAATSGEVPARGAGGSGTTAQIALSIEEEPRKKNPYSPREVDDAFSAFWDYYPRKAGKKAARAAFVKALKPGTAPMDIVEGALRFSRDPNLPEPQFVPHPTTWLNQGRWEDEPLPVRSGGRPPAAVEAGLALVADAEEREGVRALGALQHALDARSARAAAAAARPSYIEPGAISSWNPAYDA